MSVSYRFKNPIPSVLPRAIEAPAAPSYRPRTAEAPDAGYLAREAPESGRGHQLEAPDAGEGRMSHIEHGFTRGRSQS